MILPVRTDSPLRYRPWMNWAVILANLAAFGADILWRRMGHVSLGVTLALNASDPALVRFFTYAFVHQGWVHLLANMAALYIFGANVNDRLGHLGYLALYLTGVVFAGIGFVVTEDAKPIIGSSGAVMAVMGAYLALYPRSNITILSLFLGTFEIPSMYLITVFFLFDVLMRFAGESNVAHVAHISGLLMGFALSMGLLALGLLPRDQWDFLALLQRWRRRRQYQVLVRRGFNPFGYAGAAQPPPPGKPEPNVLRMQELRAQISEALAHHNTPHAAILFLELRGLDAQQVLSRQAQLDVANQLASQRFYPQAADAYEQFLTHYPNYEAIEHVELMLGVIYCRYLGRHDRAKDLLTHALQRLHSEREIAMARAELRRIETAAAIRPQ